MRREDFLRIIGAEEGTEYAPVAGMLSSGYGFAGYYNSRLNEDMERTCVLINARLVDLRGIQESRSAPRISDFAEFVEQIVRQNYQAKDAPQAARSDMYGKSIPLAAISLDEIAVAYPVAQIGKMMGRLKGKKTVLPGFLDFESKSEVLKILRTKVW